MILYRIVDKNTVLACHPSEWVNRSGSSAQSQNDHNASVCVRVQNGRRLLFGVTDDDAVVCEKRRIGRQF